MSLRQCRPVKDRCEHPPSATRQQRSLSANFASPTMRLPHRSRPARLLIILTPSLRGLQHDTRRNRAAPEKSSIARVDRRRDRPRVARRRGPGRACRQLPDDRPPRGFRVADDPSPRDRRVRDRPGRAGGTPRCRRRPALRPRWSRLIARWDQLDITDPERPRLTCSINELREYCTLLAIVKAVAVCLGSHGG